MKKDKIKTHPTLNNPLYEGLNSASTFTEDSDSAFRAKDDFSSSSSGYSSGGTVYNPYITTTTPYITIPSGSFEQINTMSSPVNDFYKYQESIKLGVYEEILEELSKCKRLPDFISLMVSFEDRVKRLKKQVTNGGIE